MPAFTTEERVRIRFFLADIDALPTEVVAPLIDDAHALLLRELDSAFAEPDPVPEPLMLGETLLAGARVLRTVASREAQNAASLRLGSQSVQTTPRFRSLNASADAAESEAWLILAPYLLPRLRRAPMASSDTHPVIGGR